MNVIVQWLSAVIGWHLAQSAEVLHVVCIRVSVPSGVPKLAFRLSALSAWATALHLLGFTFRLTCFFHCVHIAHVAYPSSASGGLGCHKFERLQIFLVWKWLCTCLFQTLFLSFGQMPRDSLVWSYCNCTFNFSMECNIDFYSGSVVLYSYELCISASSP